MNRLTHHLKNPNRIIDIGANVGEFSKSLHSIFSDCEFYLIEANENCEKFLLELPFKYDICGLGKTSEEVDFYIENINPVATGASVKKENTKFYSEGLYHVKKIKLETLDSKKYFENNKIDLLKLDVQGSELDILRGGKQTLHRSDFVLLECSNIEYNKNSPLFDEVNQFMNSEGFYIVDIIDFIKMETNFGIIIGQINVLFKNMNIY